MNTEHGIPLDLFKKTIQGAMVEAFFEVIKWLAIMIVILASLSYILPIGRDSTDEQGWFAARSGMSLRVDHGTGCHYLSNGGGIHPRLDKNGDHIGCDGQMVLVRD